ncbi:MAG: hypothetical protein B1H40_00165 [Candidatus Latescibacteria bacterium 4484_181]|nr:MAG: hypothetical protein B1H40_00165 [Candidatus Latescibacteria bacterium 4484_181]
MIVDNSQDIIDSRDIIARIVELHERAEDDLLEPEEQEELDILTSLAEQADRSPDWEYGETLIRDSYFKQYAQELAEDIGAVQDISNWPLYCIDWEWAAQDLKADYFCVDFDGVDYWFRN